MGSTKVKEIKLYKRLQLETKELLNTIELDTSIYTKELKEYDAITIYNYEQERNKN
jgi:hypothetical protein